FACIAGGSKLRILDISRPWAPRQVGKTIAHSGEQVTIDGDYLFTSRSIIDISNPKKPRELKRLPRMFEIGIDNGLLFSVKGGGLEILDVNEVLDVSKPNPKVLKKINCGKDLRKVFAHKRVIYLGFESGILRSCKLEKDLSITKLDEIQLAKGSGCILRDMCEEDDLIYVALYEMGIVSVDIENPSELKVYARFNTPKFAERIVVSDAFVYVADGQGGTIIVDMAEPGYEKIVASYPTTDWTRGIGVSGNYVFSCEDDNGIAVFVSNLSELKKKSTVVRESEEKEVPSPKDDIKVPSDYKKYIVEKTESLITDGAFLEPVAALGDSCYYAAEISEDLICGITGQRLKIFRKDNIEDVVGSYWLHSMRGGMLEYYSGHVYLAQGNKGLKIFDVRDPADIRFVGELDTGLGSCSKIAIRNDKLMFVDKIGAAIVIMSLADPANPKEVSRKTLGDRNITWFDCSFSPSDGRIYIIGRETKEDSVLVIVDVAEVYSPSLVGLYDLEKGSRGELTVNGNYIYTYDGSDELFHIHKILGKAAIEYKGAVKAHHSLGQSLARGTHIIGVGGGACVYDLTNPLKPKLVRHHYNSIPNDLVVTKSVDYQANPAGKLEPIVGFPHLIDGRGRFDYYAGNMIVHGHYLYMFGGEELRVIDISEPWNPQFAGLLTGVYGGRKNVLIKGDYIFTAREVIDISEPSKPKRVKQLSNAECVAMHDNHLFVT
ncbi:MAG: LVIVD repeat-containing protein, partial [Planctomycetota bacterium]